MSDNALSPATTMSDERDIPRTPLLLGLAGLLPFWALAIVLLLHVPLPVRPAQAAAALAAYGAVILSFLGGIRWGLAMTRSGSAADYAVSVLPALIGWLLLPMPDPWRLAGLGLVAIALGPLDLKLVHAGHAPLWFARLRLVLSSGAGSALLLAALGLW